MFEPIFTTIAQVFCGGVFLTAAAAITFAGFCGVISAFQSTPSYEERRSAFERLRSSS